MSVNEKISNTQFGLLIFNFISASIILTVPGSMVAFAKQNAWLSIFPASVTGLLTVWVLTTLSKRYPGLTLMQYTYKIVGKWPGKLLGLYYIYHWFFLIPVIFISMPCLSIRYCCRNLSIMILAGLTVYAGIEVIGRCNELLTPPIIIFLILLLTVSVKDLDFEQVEPFLEKGLLPVL